MVFLQYDFFRTLKLNVFKSLALYFMQSKCFSPICFRICIFRSLHWTYHVPHFWQIKHFYLQCVTICVFRCFRCENPLTHILQLNEFSQVCLLVCFFRLPLLTNPVPHSMHINGFPPACFCLWHWSQFFCIFFALHSLQAFSQICFTASKS